MNLRGVGNPLNTDIAGLFRAAITVEATKLSDLSLSDFSLVAPCSLQVGSFSFLHEQEVSNPRGLISLTLAKYKTLVR